MLHAVDPSHKPYELKDITGTVNQFRMMVDMCHVFGIAVLLDVVYNHAGGDFGDKSMYFFDRQPYGDNNRSQYFTDQGWAGGLVFAYWKQEVKQFLIDNAVFYLDECHCDGFRYDEVSVIKNEGGAEGWKLCQYVTDTCHYVKPEAIHIAECWPPEQAIVERTHNGGAGFDALQNDGLRDAVRTAVGQASRGRESYVDLDRVAANLRAGQLHDGWRAVQCIENHDVVYCDRDVRLARLADGSNPHQVAAGGRTGSCRPGERRAAPAGRLAARRVRRLRCLRSLPSCESLGVPRPWARSVAAREVSDARRGAREETGGGPRDGRCERARDRERIRRVRGVRQFRRHRQGRQAGPRDRARLRRAEAVRTDADPVVLRRAGALERQGK